MPASLPRVLSPFLETQCDLALLTTDSTEFWENTEPLKLGGIPNLQDPVAVVGYPTGGDNISVSVGVVSRVEPQQYVHGAASLLAIQIDAAINPGNSGGPAIMNHEVPPQPTQTYTRRHTLAHQLLLTCMLSLFLSLYFYMHRLWGSHFSRSKVQRI